MSQALKVLYVDDEPDIREVAVMALELDPGVDAQGAASGDEALALLTEGRFRPDVVLLDVMMPRQDGPAVLASMRERGLAVPVIFITARARSHEVAGFLELGAVGVIPKPFDPMTLALEVRAVLARASQ